MLGIKFIHIDKKEAQEDKQQQNRPFWHYRQTCNIRRTGVGQKIVDRSDIVEASPVSAASTTSSFST